MNKTININLGGVVFQINDNAYEKLEVYLNAVKKKFSASESTDEILNDIEARMAEVFTEILKREKVDIINLNHVDEVINIIGRPEEFESEGEAMFDETGESSHLKKRLFRNPDDKILGGVCSGISAYFGIADPIWIRLTFVLLVIFGAGSSIIVYIVLWIIVPEATTTTEKMQMRGEKITLNNIEKSMKKEFDDIKKKWNNVDASKTKREAKNLFKRIGSFFSELFGRAGRAAVVIIGLAFIIGGSLFFFSLVVGTMAGVDAASNHLTDLAFAIVQDKTDFVGASLSVAFLLLIPCILLVLGGFRLILGPRMKFKGIFLTSLGIWVLSLGVVTFVGLKTGLDFSNQAYTEEKHNLGLLSSDTLYVDLNHNTKSFFWLNIRNSHLRMKTSQVKIENGKVFIDDAIELRIKPSLNDSFYLEVNKYASGKNTDVAVARAQNINYNLKQNDSSLILDRYISFQKNNLIRNQSVSLVLKVPEGKTIYFSPRMKSIAGSLVTDDDQWIPLAGHFFQMKKEHLECLDCNQDKIKKEENDHPKEPRDSTVVPTII